MKEGMTPERWQKLKRIFNKAVELTGDERKSYLEKVCGGDVELQKEVHSLLEAHESEGMLDNPPEHLYSSLFSPSAGKKKGTRVGAYKILEPLGHGGMGNVYLAERADGQFEKKVALKLLRAGFTSDDQIQRFVNERQILATLNNENIARLLDGGVTEEGQPWFAMEFVEGKPIDEFCDSHHLTIKERLKLFLKICDAVQYAHGKLIVHRDIKPSNILVTDDGTVKLLDFGIAKVLNSGQELSNTSLTKTGLLPLTPAYASPEQVRGDTLDTSSDIYQLGIILYELLSGCRPYDVDGRTPSEVEQIICEKQPVKPSTAITKNSRQDSEDTLKKVSTARRIKPEQLQKRLKGDLDTIILKALRKEPDRRYDSAEQLASDIRNFLEGRPVTAHPDSVGYRTAKFMRRHNKGVAATAVILFLLIAYAVTVTRHSQLTQEALEQAKQETAKAEQVTGLLINMFEATDPAQTLGDTVNTRLLLERGIAQAELLEGQPDIQARMFDVAGRVYMALGQYSDAEPLIKRGLQLRKDLFGEKDVSVSASLHNLARLYKENGMYEQAGKLYHEALEIRQENLSPGDPRIAESLYHLGMFHQRVHGDLETAESYFRQSLDMRRNAYGTHHEKVAESYRGLGGILMTKGNYEKAEDYYTRALAIQEKALGNLHPETITTINNTAILKAWRGNYDSAVSLLKESLEHRHKVLGSGHHSSAIQLNNLAFIAGHQGDYTEAENLLNEALSVMEATVGLDHPHALVFKTNLGRVKHVAGDLETAETLHRETLNTKEELLGSDHPDVVASLVQLGSLLKDKGNYNEAESLLQRAISIGQEASVEGYPLLISGYFMLGQINMTKNDFEAAGEMMSRALKIRQESYTVDQPEIAVAHSLQGACLTDLELYVEAESLIMNVQSLLPQINEEGNMLKEELLRQIINLYENWKEPASAAKYRQMLAAIESE